MQRADVLGFAGGDVDGVNGLFHIVGVGVHGGGWVVLLQLTLEGTEGEKEKGKVRAVGSSKGGGTVATAVSRPDHPTMAPAMGAKARRRLLFSILLLRYLPTLLCIRVPRPLERGEG